MKNQFICIVLLLLHISCSLTAQKKKNSKKPNIIFVFSDDQRFNSLGMTGHPVSQTPNIDQLAKEGVFFNNAYITSPICGPSRANIFTGQWERKNQIGFTHVSNNVISKRTFEDSFLMKLKDIGYSTAFIGKHHTTVANKRDSPIRDNIDFAYFKKGHIGFYLDKHPEFSNLKNKTQVEGIFEATEAYLLQDKTTDYFFKNADKNKYKGGLKKRDPNKPFCAWINFNLPHAASIGGMGTKPEDPEYYVSLYEDKKDEIPFPENYPQEIKLPKTVFERADLMKYYKTWAKPALLNKKLKMNRAVYAIDLFMGNLRKLLVAVGEAENTIIVFCSDNGLFQGEHGLGGKSMLYEESAHVPMVIYSPFFSKDKAGKKVNEFVVGQDIPATILDMCGIKTPKNYQGESVLPLIEDKKVTWRKDIFLENLFTDQGYPRHEAVRGEKYKYIRYFSRENDRNKYLPEASKKGEKPIYEELFNLDEDPKEMNNLAYDKAYKTVLETYQNRCQELVVQYSK